MGETPRVRNTANGCEMVIINVEALKNSMKENLLSLGRDPSKRMPCTIYRVFHSVRRDDEHAYDPQIIAIGPFHRDKHTLKPMESLKWRYLRHLIDRNPEKNSVERYVDAVNEFKEETRSYYMEPIEPNDNVLVEMMVLDGCFLIEFLVKSYLGDNVDHLNMVNWNLPLLRSDLLLLENQFPFPILKLLFDMSDIQDLIGMKEDESEVTLMNLVVSFVTRNKRETLEVSKPNIHHLLHAYHASILTIPNSNQDQPTSCCGHKAKAIKTLTRIKTLVSAPVLWLLSSFLYCKIPLNCWGSRKSHEEQEKAKAPRRILTATQLQNSGVKFEKGYASSGVKFEKGDASSGVKFEKEDASSFLFAKFCKETGVMKIAQLAIQEATISQFRNLIAFEQCNPESGTHFTSHAVLMDNLIDTPEDVAILKSSHIIESKLGHDEEVAQFFNSLCKGAYLDFEKHHHKQLFMDVTEYCNVSRHKWRAELIHDYFGNPWSTVSVIAAVVLLILTFLSTFYAMYPYYNPRS